MAAPTVSAPAGSISTVAAAVAAWLAVRWLRWRVDPASSNGLTQDWLGLHLRADPAQTTNAAQNHLYLFVNGGQTAVWRIDLDAPDQAANYGIGNNTTVASDLTFSNGVLWFGDTAPSLHGLATDMQHVGHTPTFLDAPGVTGQAIDTTWRDWETAARSAGWKRSSHAMSHTGNRFSPEPGQ